MAGSSPSGDNAGVQLTPDVHVVVIFGASGDLSRRKLLPALYHLDAEGLMPEDYRVIGTSRSELSNEEFRSFARESVDQFGRSEVEPTSWQRFVTAMKSTCLLTLRQLRHARRTILYISTVVGRTT